MQPFLAKASWIVTAPAKVQVKLVDAAVLLPKVPVPGPVLVHWIVEPLSTAASSPMVWPTAVLFGKMNTEFTTGGVQAVTPTPVLPLVSVEAQDMVTAIVLDWPAATLNVPVPAQVPPSSGDESFTW